MIILDLLQKTKSNKPIELLYCLQCYTESTLGDKIPIWKKADNLDVLMEDCTQLIRLVQHQLDGEVYDLIQVWVRTDHPTQSDYPMLMLGHWNDGQSLY